MEILLMFVLLIVGFVFLVKGADFFVDGTSSIARLLNVPSIVVGLTIVAMGTSAPEMAVSVSAALQGSNDIVISNVLGSNMFNLLVVAGGCAVIKNLPVSSEITKRDYPISMIAALAVLVFCVDSYLVGKGSFVIGHIEGAVLFAALIAYIVFLVYLALHGRGSNDGEEIKVMSPFKSIVFTLIGAAGIVVGGDVVVDSATGIAQAFGLSDIIIGLTILAVGTSLPELVTSLVATSKGENDLAIGNVVGSNLFNLLGVLGLSAAVSPVTVERLSIIDLCVFIVLSVIVYIILRRRGKIERPAGIFMVLMYVAYMIYAILREVVFK